MKLKLFQIILTFNLVLTILISTSCNKNGIGVTDDSSGIVLPDGKLKIPISFNLPAQDVINTKAINSNKENKVNNIIVAVFDTQNKLIDLSSKLTSTINSAYVILNNINQECYLYMLANAKEEIMSQLIVGTST